MTTITWFESYWAGMKSEVGGKAASLGEMTGAGLPVPPGFAICTSAYRRARDESDLDAAIARLIYGMDVNDTDSVTERCAKIRTLISTMPIPEGIELQIRGAYLELSARAGTKEVPVAVRSSATSEDSPDASFAGEHDTYLWVRGAEDVIDAVRRCWASLFTDRATCYRVEMGYEHRAVEMSVVVQKMVHPKAAGVAFTLDPTNGDRSQVAIDAAWGFGEGVVAGEVTPDNFRVDKVMLDITKRIISAKTQEYVLTDHDSVEKVDTAPERVSQPCLTDAEIKAIAKLAKTTERHYGCPQDIEWAVDVELPEGENIILLQSRPETVWSKKGPTPVVAPGTNTGDFMSSIVSTLMSPLYAKGPDGS